MSNQLITDHILFFGRKYEEVLELFALSEDDLRDKRILDCNSGPDGFVHQARQRGFDVIGCDPLYAKSTEEIVKQGEADIAHCAARAKATEEGPGEFDLDAFFAGKREALAGFTGTFEQGKAEGYYTPGALPDLPFPDNHFDLVLSAHFLFISSHPRYGGMIDTELFGHDFHRKALRELTRVAKREVRLFPISWNADASRVHPWAAEFMGELAMTGFPIRILDNRYDQGSFTSRRTLVIEKPR